MSSALVRKSWVVKSNDLIGARYDWTALQHRLILLMIAQLDFEAEDFGNQTIYVQDLLEMSQLTGNSHHERAVEAAMVLLDQKIFIRQPSGRWRGYNLLSYVEPGSGYVVARFNPDMRPFLLHLKARFTRYRLENAMRFQSPYSTRIYELCMQFDDIGYRTVAIDDLREILVLEDKYPKFSDFKRRVLEQAREEINELADITICYEVVRKGRRPVSIKFMIQRKGNAPAQPVRAAQQTLFDEQHDMEEDAFDRWLKGLNETEKAELMQAAREHVLAADSWLADSPNTLHSQVLWYLRQIWESRDTE